MLTEISKAMTDRMIGLATELIGEYVQREAQVRSPKVGDAYTTMKLLHRRQPLGPQPLRLSAHDGILRWRDLRRR